MTLRAGTSRSGEVYRYYSCNTFLKEGPDGVPGAIRAHGQTGPVMQHLADRLLEPERLTTLLRSLAGRRAEKAAAVDRPLAALAREAEEAVERLRRLYKLLEGGRDEVDDIQRARITGLKLSREKAHAALERARSATYAVAAL
jgi:site-specific DNA recombinase